MDANDTPVLPSMLIGHLSTLPVLRVDTDTVWLDGSEAGSVPLALHEVPRVSVGEQLRVFVFSDQTGKPVATVKQPRVSVGECANLTVTAVTDAGAWLDWGIAKDLLLPFAEQRRPVEVGQHESVLVYVDNSGRLAASSKLDAHLPDSASGFQKWQQVTLLVYQRTDLGFKAVVDNRAVGLIFKDEIFQPVRTGDSLTGYIKQQRADGRLDIALQLPASETLDATADDIMDYLQKHDGVCKLSDKSSPEQIYATFKVSKNQFKRALGGLYKKRLIRIEPDRVVMLERGS